ncbi:MAG: peroxiredoxin [Aquificae bacterium]|nr:peroxiredoxin [Aquificota bacterium]
MIKEGDRLPEFRLEGVDEEGKVREFSLNDFKGKKLVLYFYPKDNTPGCTTEAKEFNELLDEFRRLGYEVVGVSPDAPASHLKFKQKLGLRFPLLSDPNKELARALGAYGKKKSYGRVTEGIIRSTFLIDEEGRLVRAWRNVKAKGHAERLLKTLKS